jgi:hypothetical protein
MRTRSQTALVNPAMHLCTLLLELVNPGLHVSKLVLELLNLLRVWADGLVEGLGKQVGHGLWLVAHGGGAVVHGGRHGAVAVGEAACGQRRLLGLLLARVHVGVFGGRRGLLLVGFLAARVGAFLCVVVEGLRAGRGVVLYVAVGAGTLQRLVSAGLVASVGVSYAFEEHYEEGETSVSGKREAQLYGAAGEVKLNYAPLGRLGQRVMA